MTTQLRGSGITLDKIMSSSSEAQRKTNIVCTMGPSCWDTDKLVELIDAGMNVARLNFSHANHEEHLERIKMIRELNEEKNTYVGILADTKGPEIRVGQMDGAVRFEKGDIVKISKEPVLGNHDMFHIDCPELFEDLTVGQFILIDDGKMKFEIKAMSKDIMTVETLNPGVIKTRKGVNVPNVKLSMPFVSEKDRSDILFAAEHNVDVIALSFVRRAEDVLEVRNILKEAGKSDIELIAKIENQEGVDNLESILEVVDGIMVARGDLGVEVSTQLVPIYQKKIIRLANEVGKPVITATHMLESMVSNPRPTRAEASDVANAILDGSDAIMLSGETAAGDYPIEAVQTMDTIALAIEPILPYESRLRRALKIDKPTINDAIGIAVSQAALSLPTADVIVAFTETGGTAKRISRFRPADPIIAVTDRKETCTRLSYYWGVTAYYSKTVDDFTSYDDVAIKTAKKYGFEPGTTVITTSGWAQHHGATNTLRIITIPEK